MVTRTLVMVVSIAGIAATFVACGTSYGASPDDPAEAGADDSPSNSTDSDAAETGHVDGATLSDSPAGECPATPGLLIPPPLGPTMCPGGEFDLANNPAHCGACDYVCSAGKSCVAGICDSELFGSASADFPVVGLRTANALFTVETATSSEGGIGPSKVAEHPNGGVPVVVATLANSARSVTADTLGTYINDYSRTLTAISATGFITYQTANVTAQSISARSGLVTYYDGTNHIHQLDVTGRPTVFSVTATDVASMAVDDVSVFWVTPDEAGTSATLWSARFSGGALRSTSLTTTPTALVVDDVYVYYYAAEQKELRRIAKDLGSPSELLGTWSGTGGNSAASLVVEGDYVYALLERAFNQVVIRLPRCGGTPRAVAPEIGVDINRTGRLAFDSTYMYYATDLGSLRRVPK